MDDPRAFWQRLKRQRMGLLGLGMLLVVIAVAVFAPVLAPYDPKENIRVTIDMIYAPPNASYWLGTDDAGRDVLTNLMYGA
ncbi:MAG TPA: ABC transporter permease, partial [Anaerolineae bacterium]